jgi:hypothetical protein
MVLTIYDGIKPPGTLENAKKLADVGVNLQISTNNSSARVLGVVFGGYLSTKLPIAIGISA